MIFFHRDKQFLNKTLYCRISNSDGNTSQRDILKFIKISRARDPKLSFRSAERLTLFGDCIRDKNNNNTKLLEELGDNSTLQIKWSVNFIQDDLVPKMLL